MRTEMSKNQFEQAVLNTPSLGKDAYQSGLDALTKAHHSRVDPKPCEAIGSVNLEQALKSQFPNSPLWDYGIGLQRGNRAFAIWLEVHPANTSNVEEVLKKLGWLKDWLKQNAPDLWKLTRQEDSYYWVATDGVHITRDSPQARRLSKAGLSMPRKRISPCP